MRCSIQHEAREPSRRGALVTSMILACTLYAPPHVSAFCGPDAAGTEAVRDEQTTTWILMREGNRTVVSIQNEGDGAPDDFVMVVPVPGVVRREDVRRIDPGTFGQVGRATGPRLDEYWERDPCAPDVGTDRDATRTAGSAAADDGWSAVERRRAGGVAGRTSSVRVETQFAVGEYDVVVLGTQDSSALETWLREHQSPIAAGTGEALRPYVEAGMYFLVARVDAERVPAEGEGAALSPLRIQYDSPELFVPIRVAPSHPSRHQDVVAIVIARGQRFEVTNHAHVFIPTNLDVADAVREDFGAFYDALLARTMERNPAAVVTEYASRDTTLDPWALSILGGDVLYRDGVWATEGGSPVRQHRGVGGRLCPSHAEPTPRMTADAPRVTGMLAPELVQRVTRAHAAEVRHCYQQGLASRPTAAGGVDVSYTIAGATGLVSSASVVARPDATLSDTVVACMRDAFRRWTFHTPQDRRPVRVVQGLHFTASPPASCVPAPPPPAGAPRRVSAAEFVATRLHYRCRPDGLAEDVALRAASLAVGGRALLTSESHVEEGASESEANDFQARFAIRHAWDGEISCQLPVRGRWDRGASAGALRRAAPAPEVSPPDSVATAPTDTGARGVAVALETLVLTPVAALGLPGHVASDATAPSAAVAPPAMAAPPSSCRATRASAPHMAWLVGMALSALAHRIRRSRSSSTCRRRAASREGGPASPEANARDAE